MTINRQIQHVAIIGAGSMGGGIAQVFAMAGLDVVIADADPGLTRQQLDRLRNEAKDFEAQGLFEVGSADLVEAHLMAADSLEDAVAAADLIVEAVLEQPDIKGPVLKRIEAAARPDAIIGTNTSTLPIGQLATKLTHANRFLGVHFAYPAPFIPGVEVIAHAGTDKAAVKAVETTLARAGKLSAAVNDKAGFVLNRLQFVLLKEAANIVEEGVASAEDIDTVVRTTFGYRLPFFGPFAIADIAGLDVFQDCFTTFQDHYGERLAAPEMLTKLVNAGHRGVKKGGGFVIPDGDHAALNAYRNTAYAKLGQLLRELGPAPL